MLSSLYAALAALLIVRLSLGVIKLRRAHKVRLGDGGVPELEAAIRAQGNAVEYLPISLILLLLLGRYIKKSPASCYGIPGTIGKGINSISTTVYSLPFDRNRHALRSVQIDGYRWHAIQCTLYTGRTLNAYLPLNLRGI